jgi:hypothetical protein
LRTLSEAFLMPPLLLVVADFQEIQFLKFKIDFEVDGSPLQDLKPS